MNMKKIINGFLAGAVVFGLASCGPDTESMLDKVAKLKKLGNQLGNQLGHIDEAQLKTANDKIDKALTDNKAELSKKLKDNCKSEDLKKLDQQVDCKINEVEKHIKDKTIPGPAEISKKCPDVDTVPECKKVIDEVNDKLS
jgi:hypothetical protein